ncbi:hypothetical protein [Desulfobotulus sp.]|uniref:hypothetical protein n=1 Tax=Desulfobotulus sp. TaxID=1940337 RepID=UPI002A36F153|nr:hypothetical protein [Desulfobotulus sp.]MDY0161729.1 hypothetical protein [Desulfobotulus sp.]
MPRCIRHDLLRFFLTIFLVFLISGCATYSKQIDQATLSFREGDFVTAEQKLQEVLSAERNSLLRNMELGVLRHEQGDYLESNRLLEEAYLKAEDLYGVTLRELMTRASTNATMLPYKSEIFEKIYIHYYKMLNYIQLAEQVSGEERRQLLDGVRIEGRRAQILLDDHLFRTGSYEEAEEDKARLLNQLMDLFAKLNGEVINPRELTFRDNAFLHYMMGVMYEQYGELDNARISYERSASIYEKGYVRQYGLSPEMVDQVKFDAARILKTQKDTRWQRVASTITSPELKRQLEAYVPGRDGNLLVIQEVDLSAPKGELNLLMRLNADTNELQISPILIGTPDERAYQLSWFYYLYAPKGIINAVQRIHQEGYYNPNEIRPKTIGIGPLRPTMDKISGLVDALKLGIRLAVPLYYYDAAPFQSSLLVNGKPAGNLMDADSIAGLQMANALVRAQSELTQAMAVESLRLTTCILTGMPPYACSLAAASTSMADTRSWLTLPHTIRIQRLVLPQGSYQIRLVSYSNAFRHEQASDLTLQAGDQQIVRKRSMAGPR